MIYIETPISEKPEKNGYYIVIYKSKNLLTGKLYWWDTFWANGNVDVTDDLKSWLKPVKEGEDEMWQELIHEVELHQKRQTEYPDVINKLKSQYKLTKR